MTNMCLKDWCYHWNFVFVSHGVVYRTPSMLETDGFHLSKRGKRTPGLAGVIERVWQG